MPNYVANMIDFSNTDKAVFDRICAFMNTENDNSVEDGVLFDFNRLVPMPESLNIESGSNTEVGKELAYIMDDGAFDERRQYDSAWLLYLMETEGITSQNRPFFTGAEAKRFAQNTETGRLLLQLGRTAIQNLEKYSAQDWYDWSTENWGTKWNACDVCISEGAQQIFFCTAWSFPEPIAYALANKFPDSEFVWKYAGEDCGQNAGCFKKTGDKILFERFENRSDAAYQLYSEDKKKEAVVRMKKLGVFPEIIRQFAEDDLVSQSLPPVGACFWIEGEQLERVRELEKKYDAAVYHVIHSFTNIGELENYMYVSDHSEEWEQDRKDIEQEQQFCYVFNHDAPECSEFGTIGIALTPAAGLCRTW